MLPYIAYMDPMGYVPLMYLKQTVDGYCKTPTKTVFIEHHVFESNEQLFCPRTLMIFRQITIFLQTSSFHLETSRFFPQRHIYPQCFFIPAPLQKVAGPVWLPAPRCQKLVVAKSHGCKEGQGEERSSVGREIHWTFMVISIGFSWNLW